MLALLDTRMHLLPARLVLSTWTNIRFYYRTKTKSGQVPTRPGWILPNLRVQVSYSFLWVYAKETWREIFWAYASDVSSVLPEESVGDVGILRFFGGA